MSDPSKVVTLVQAQAAAWSNINPPNAIAEQFAGALADVITGLSALRGGLAFEQEPASFLTALQETKEIAQ